MVKQLTHDIHGINISLEPFLNELANGWSVSTPSGVIIRTGIVDTPSKAQQLFQAAQQLHLAWKNRNPSIKMPFRMSVCMLCMQSDEWALITNQNILMTWLQFQQSVPDQCIMLSIPTEHFYLPKNKPPESEFFLKAIAKLPALLNSGAWETYCRWINEEIEVILQNIPLESMDSYTLEAYLKNFNHEISSELLRNLERDIQNVLLKMGAIHQMIEFPFKETDTTIDLEKRLIKARSEVRRLLKFQYDTLCQIEHIIPIIEDSHPSFLPLKYKVTLFRALIENQLDIPDVTPPSWTQMLMLLQLLHEELGVLTVINCDTGLDRTSMAFAVMLSTSLIKQHFPKEKIMDAALHWIQTVLEVNKKIARLSREQLDSWLYSLSTNEEEAALKQRAGLVIKFRDIFLGILENLCIPLTKSAGKVQDLIWLNSQKVSNKELLYLLPIEGEVTGMDGRRSKTKIVNLDENGTPTDLTNAGHFLMTQLFPS